MNKEEEYLSVDEAAEAIGRSRATIWNLIRRYNLETFRRSMDRRTYVRRADIEQLARGTFEPRPREASAAA